MCHYWQCCYISQYTIRINRLFSMLIISSIIGIILIGCLSASNPCHDNCSSRGVIIWTVISISLLIVIITVVMCLWLILYSNKIDRRVGNTTNIIYPENHPDIYMRALVTHTIHTPPYINNFILVAPQLENTEEHSVGVPITRLSMGYPVYDFHP